MNKLQTQQLLEAIRAAGAKLMELWPGIVDSKESLAIEAKADGTLVSRADLLSNEMLLGAITRMFPGDTILSEESPINATELANSSRTWVVDPLDGTSSFLNGRDDFSILVALCEKSEPTFGVMFFPARQQLVIAKKGEGAFVNGHPLRVSKTTHVQPGRIYIRNFECSRPEVASPMMDSGLAFLKVASGELDGAILRMKTHREWDIAAPMCVLLEAGGAVSDQTGSRIPCATGAINFEYFVASNCLIHKQLEGLIP